jgi:predicted DNA-binding protein with PD1-like motif
MRSQIIYEGEEKTWALVFQTGDEVAGALEQFARENRLSASHFTAIGAFSDVTLGYFNLEKKDYKKIPVTEQVEVLSLIGDVALHGDEPKIHAHVVLGRSDGTTCGGHLIQAHVRPTLEVILTESPRHLHRRVDPATGLALLHLEK